MGRLFRLYLLSSFEWLRPIDYDIWSGLDPGIYICSVDGKIFWPISHRLQRIVVFQQLLWIWGNDTTLCNGQYIQLGSNVSASSYLWSNTQTANSILVNSPGTYWLQISTGSCTQTDTIQVNFTNCNQGTSFNSTNRQCARELQLILPICRQTTLQDGPGHFRRKSIIVNRAKSFTYLLQYSRNLSGYPDHNQYEWHWHINHRFSYYHFIMFHHSPFSPFSEIH